MADQQIKDKVCSASRAVAVTVATATYDRSEGVYIGVSGSYDMCFDGTNWILFSGLVAGTVMPFQVLGVRDASDAAPDAGDIVLVY